MSREANNRTILLVEDNPHDEALTLRALRKEGLAEHVVVVRDGAEALALLLGDGAATDPEAGFVPAVILLDLKLPKVDGLEVLRQVRADARTRLLPIVVLTSSKEERDMIESYTLGCNSYIRKPVDFVQFGAAVQQLGLYWLVLNVAPPKIKIAVP
jgi:two-component system response regulator